MSAEPAAKVVMPDNNAMPDYKNMPVGPDDHAPVPFPTPPHAQSNPHFTSPSPMADNALSRFLGGPPVNVLVRLVFLSLIVGALLIWLDIRPWHIIEAFQRFVTRIYAMGFDAIREAGQYIVAGALIVVPVWFVTRLLNGRGGR